MNLRSIIADMTIISATRNVDTGLPGFLGSDCLRDDQQHVTMNGLIIPSALPNPQTLLAESKWATRGWMYLEGMLSMAERSEIWPSSTEEGLLTGGLT